MAKVTPAQISYTPTGQAEQTIKFHAVLAETHNASSQVTKFPVQTGFIISNNVIRKNRMITIRGIITNTILEGTKNNFIYSDTNNNATIFEALESLVQSGEPCNVMTNLGEYDPVIFTKFNTTQAKGSVDIMEFTITGEEVQVSDTVKGTAPKVLTFSNLTGAAKLNRTDMLEAVGIDICECNEMSEASLTMGQDFILKGVNSAGVPVQTTYLATGQDSTTGIWNYDVHTSDTLIYPEDTGDIDLGTDDLVPLIGGGFAGVSDCLRDEAGNVLEQAREDTINTAMGELRKSIYGAVYSAVAMSDNEYGQTLIQAGIGCIVRGVTNEDSEFPYTPGEALPTTPQIMEGARALGTKLFDKARSKSTNGLTGSETTITKITCC